MAYDCESLRGSFNEYSATLGGCQTLD